MLVISRKQDECLVIDTGDGLIEITVTDIAKQVRLGIDAPDRFKIWRKEIYTTAQENKSAIVAQQGADIRGLLKNIKANPPSE